MVLHIHAHTHTIPTCNEFKQILEMKWINGSARHRTNERTNEMKWNRVGGMGELMTMFGIYETELNELQGFQTLTR